MTSRAFAVEAVLARGSADRRARASDDISSRTAAVRIPACTDNPRARSDSERARSSSTRMRSNTSTTWPTSTTSPVSSAHLARDASFERLADLQHAAGQTPLPRQRLESPLDQNDARHRSAAAHSSQSQPDRRRSPSPPRRRQRPVAQDSAADCLTLAAAVSRRARWTRRSDAAESAIFDQKCDCSHSSRRRAGVALTTQPARPVGANPAPTGFDAGHVVRPRIQRTVVMPARRSSATNSRASRRGSRRGLARQLPRRPGTRSR